MSDLKFTLDTSRYSQALTEYLKRSKRGSEEVLQQQAKLIVKKAIDLTPPGKEGVAGLAARELGEKSVESNLNKIFHPTAKKGKSTAERIEITQNSGDMAMIHKSYRNNKGRVPRSLGASRFKVWRPDFNEYMKLTKGRVGRLAHGWASAAQKLGITLPAWINRHSGSEKGSIQVRSSASKIEVKLVNDVTFAADVAGMQGKLNRAVRLQERAIIRQVNDLLKDDSPFRRV